MKKSLLLLMLLPIYGFTQNASDLLVRWEGTRINWSSPTPNPMYYNNSNSNMLASNFTSNNVGMTIEYSGFQGYNWPTATTPDYTKYFQVTVTPATGKQLLAKFFRFQQSGYCKRIQIRYSKESSFPGNGTLLYENTSASSQQNTYLNAAFPESYTVNSGETLYIRIYGFERDQYNSPWKINFDQPVNNQANTNGVAPGFYGTVSEGSTPLAANNDTASTVKNNAVNIAVLGNDSLGGGTVSSLVVSTAASHGTTSVQGNNTITYTPANNYVGTDSFVYTLTNNSGASDTATVNVTISQPAISGALCGTYVISSTAQNEYQQFSSITQAVAYLNQYGVSCPVTFLLKDSAYNNTTGETFPITINSFNGSSATNTVTFKPATGVNARIEAFRDPVSGGWTAVPAVFKFDGADNIILDGSNVVNGTTRNLFLANSSYTGNEVHTSTSNDYTNRTVIWVASESPANGSENITVKYAQIKQTYKNNPDKYCVGIYSGDNGNGNSNELSIAVAKTSNSNLTVLGNDFINVKQGVYINGESNKQTTNVVISQNDLGAEDNTETIVQPVYLSNVNGFEVSENLIYKLYRDNTAGNLAAGGIYIDNNTASGVIEKNNLSELIRTETNSEPFFGIRLSSTVQNSNILVVNNFILNVAGQGNGGEIHNGYGIFAGNGGGYKIYNNTVKLEKNQTSSERNYSAALYIYSGVTGLDVRNNIFVNAQTNSNTERYAIAVLNPSASTFTNLNYNNYYSTKFIGMYGPSITDGGNPYAQTTLSGWATATGKDANSKNVNPAFTSATDLHIDYNNTANADINNAGTPLTEVTKDIDGQVRNTSNPDMGADEFGNVQMPTPGSNEGIYCDSSTTWNGTAWSNGVPTLEKDAIFTGNYSQTGGTFYACSVFVTGTAQVNFLSQANATVTHNVNVETGAALTFESSCNLIQVENSQNSGNVTVKRDSGKLKRLDYTMWASPVSGSQTLQEFSPLTLSNRFYVYDTASDLYAATSASNTFTKAKGYLIRVPNSFPETTPTVYNGEFKGVPNNGNVYIPLVRESSSNAYNAVGNPYPSPISVTDFINANIDNIEGTIWMWRKTNNSSESSYCTITKFAYQANNAAGGGGGSDVSGNDLIFDPFKIDDSEGALLNTGQGFIVKAKNTQNLVFKNNMRRSTNFNYFFRSAENSEAASSPQAMDASRIWINVTNEGGSFSQAVIGYTPLATLGYDNGLDGRALSPGTVSVYSLIEDVRYAIQARPAFDVTDAVQLGFKASTAGTFEIKIDHADGLFEDTEQPIYLHDKLLNEVHNLKDGAYSFSSDAGTFNERFEVIYTVEALGVDTPQQVNVKDIVVYRDGKNVKVQSPSTIQSVEVYDLTGRVIYQNGNADTTEFTSPALSIAQQVVIVRVTLDNQQVVSKKIMVN